MSAKKHVLVVDDDEAILHGTQLRVAFNGYEVSIAANGAQAFDKAVSLRPDAILMDVRMPVMDGLKALAKLKADPRTSDIPVVIASASPGDKHTSLESGAHFFLTKPYINQTMLSAIASSLASQSPANI
ncbi:response regulator [Rubripirellula reticaptiva]|uniref:Response regulator PleD n=1 Tax=Rubripirellula reticaptiva TaxID=2528013 RepID=A0A5C6EW96_9BACT|nr:response regulator [Rubripirellula reticaptiva]TWU51749.1 Response regulator PleD [Rubripirellula reticaptiva]